MAHQARKVIDIGVNQENIKPKKMVQKSQSLATRRPAFCEVGNIQQTKVVKKPVLVEPFLKAVKKKTENIPEKKPAKRTESLVLKSKKPVGNTYVPKGEAYSSQLVGIFNVDTSDDPLRVSEYVQDIYGYLLQLEKKYSINNNFLEGHATTPRMRSILVNWMVEVHTNFKFLLETLHLSVAVVDRYLQINKKVGRDTLQLVGTAAMLISGKYEEIYIPDLEDFVYICDDTFTKKQLIAMEFEILKKLDFNLGRPLALHFLRRYNKICSVHPEHHTLGKYLLELSLTDYELCHLKPSLLGAAACCLSISILDGLSDPVQAWNRMVTHYSTYKYTDIKSVVVKLACALGKTESNKLKAVTSKYATAAYGKISLHSNLRGSLVRKLIASKK